jgi:hypothetical protein
MTEEIKRPPLKKRSNLFWVNNFITLIQFISNHEHINMNVDGHLKPIVKYSIYYSLNKVLVLIYIFNDISYFMENTYE